ncbi:MAG TPA: DapH/DapD/GlmU-related protein [Chryseolinea sp.]|nr:DapH/DapD/GlmU-related protein [Chryseolinea sp.]
MKNNSFDISTYIQRFRTVFPEYTRDPWYIPSEMENILAGRIRILPPEYKVSGSIAIHQSARVEEHVILKGQVIIGAGCFIGAHAYLRGGVFLDDNCIVGPGCEVKSAMIFANSALAHFNFVGDSIIGAGVNMEAGSVIANHYNERTDKTIHMMLGNERMTLPVTKFGALVGDRTKIGANAVLSPGTLLKPDSVVSRLALIEQC